MISIHTTRVGGDQEFFDAYAKAYEISIHTTRVGGDFEVDRYDFFPMWDFNPHHPCGW